MNQYIITEEQIARMCPKAEQYCNCPLCTVIREVRSHPYQSERDSWTTDEIIEHEKLAADAARDKVLDELMEKISSAKQVDICDQYFVWFEDLECVVANLRQKAGE